MSTGKMSKGENNSTIKKLYCIEYPGNVQNVDNMIETLGGIHNISDAFFIPQRKLECKFRPHDKFCKGTVGDRSSARSFLLKVVVHKNNNKANTSDEGSNIDSSSVIGKVEQVYKFRNMCDFQYLPMDKNSNEEYVSLYNEIIPQSLIDYSWLKESSVPFLPPSIFSRMDSVQGYLSTVKSAETPGNVIGRTRDKRSNFVKLVSHDSKKIPDSPNPNTLRYIHLKFITEEQILKMKELFDKRLIWTKLAICNTTQFPEVQLKYLLTLSAYYFTSGPFRGTWVRYGYDPRKDIFSRQYQIIDYRLGKDKIPEKLSYQGRNKSINDQEFCKNNKELSYIFKPGVLPPQKQMVYQICDIHIPKVQNLLNSLPETVIYDSKNGWLTEEFLEEVRHAMDDCVMDIIKNKSSERNEDVEQEINNDNLTDEENETDMLIEQNLFVDDDNEMEIDDEDFCNSD